MMAIDSDLWRSMNAKGDNVSQDEVKIQVISLAFKIIQQAIKRCNTVKHEFRLVTTAVKQHNQKQTI